MKNRRTSRLAGVVAVMAAALAATMPVADAAVYVNGSKTSNFDVTMKIIADCTIASNALDFGQSQGVLATSVSVNTTLSVTCTNTTPYNVGLNAGTGTGSTTAARAAHTEHTP